MLVSGFGIAGSLLAVVVIYALQQMFDFNLPSLTVWFVVPVGGMLCGIGAAAGYYFGAKVLGERVSKRLLFNMVAIGASTFVLIRWVTYETTVLGNGAQAADRMPFLKYWKFTVEGSSWTVRTRYNPQGFSTGPVGSFGYFLELMQFLGYLSGGLVVYSILASESYCESCGKYYRTKKLLSAATGQKVDEYLRAKRFALPSLAEYARTTLRDKPFGGFNFTLETCPSCKKRQIKVEVITGRYRTDGVGVWTLGPEVSHEL